jgi:hypothetical protein
MGNLGSETIEDLKKKKSAAEIAAEMAKGGGAVKSAVPASPVNAPGQAMIELAADQKTGTGWVDKDAQKFEAENKKRENEVAMRSAKAAVSSALSRSKAPSKPEDTDWLKNSWAR